jgi:hypothetical protein
MTPLFPKKTGKAAHGRLLINPDASPALVKKDF